MESLKVQTFRLKPLVYDMSFEQDLIIGAPQLKPEYTQALEELSGLIRTNSVFPAVSNSCRRFFNSVAERQDLSGKDECVA